MGLFDFFKKKKQRKEIVTSEQSLVVNDADKGLQVVWESLPTTLDQMQGRLMEITDTSVLARVDAVVSQGSIASLNTANVVKSLGEKTYKVILKNGGQLVDSRTLAGAKRAMTMGANGIAEHANLIESSSKFSNVTNISTTVFSIASIIVGQYYMKQIDTKIGVISDELKGITSTLDIQYRSQVASLIESVYNITKFQMAILSDEELRLRELNNIQELRKDCQTLLNQAEAEIETTLKLKQANYDSYVSAVKKVEKWSHYQSILIQVLAQINELDFTLNMGTKTKEHCYGSFDLHTNKLDEIHAQIISWHKAECEYLKIDINEEKRKNTGFFAKMLEKPITAIKKDWMYKPIDKETVGLIKSQTAEIQHYSYNTDNPFAEDIEIVIQGDKKYYLVK